MSWPYDAALSRASVLLALLLAGCPGGVERIPATQAIVTIDARDDVAAAAQTLEVSVRGGTGTPQQPDLEGVEQAPSVRPSFPVPVTILPLGGDHARIYEISARALDASGEELARATLLSGYRKDEIVRYALMLSGDCRGEDATERCTTAVDPGDLETLTSAEASELLSPQRPAEEPDDGKDDSAPAGEGGQGGGEPNASQPGGQGALDAGPVTPVPDRTDDAGPEPDPDPGPDAGLDAGPDPEPEPPLPEDCLGTPGGDAQVDQCGDCEGDGTSCLGCDGVVNSGLTLDACGACGGDGQGCIDCRGVMDGGAALDVCGMCDGPGAATWYYDADGDGLGVQSITLPACEKPDGYVSESGDPEPTCKTNDTDVCNVCGGDGTSCLGCDGMVNSGLVEDSCGECDGPGPSTYYVDDDEDGLGDPNVSVSQCGAAPAGHVATGTDPDDSCAGGVTDACLVCGGDGSSCAGCDGVSNSGREHACASVGGNCIDSSTLRSCSLDTASCRVVTESGCDHGCTSDACCVDPESLCAPDGGAAECGSVSNACGLAADCGSCGGGSDGCYLNSCCAPRCDGKQCGSDGCGGTCGNCGALEACSVDGICEAVGPSCAGAGYGCDDNGTAVSCCDAKFVLGGDFPMGQGDPGSSDYYSDDSSHDDERPEHEVTVDGFELDTFEVTVGRFRKFVEAYGGGWRPSEGDGVHPLIAGSGWQVAWDSALPADAAALKLDLKCQADYQTWTDTAGSGEQYPINCVSWYEAFAFCAWDGGRLLTEAEWEYASAGGSENRLYPWGSESPQDESERANSTHSSRTPKKDVGSYPTGAGRYGQHDLAGSVWEWTLDWYDEDYYSGAGSSCTNCANLQPGSGRVIRGGYYYSPATFFYPSIRNPYTPTNHARTVGLRCAGKR